jgi:hypothetical protein
MTFEVLSAVAAKNRPPTSSWGLMSLPFCSLFACLSHRSLRIWRQYFPPKHLQISSKLLDGTSRKIYPMKVGTVLSKTELLEFKDQGRIVIGYVRLDTVIKEDLRKG